MSEKIINHVQVDEDGAWILSSHDVEALCIGARPATSIIVMPHDFSVSMTSRGSALVRVLRSRSQ